MMVRRHASIDGFLADAGAFLAAREAEHNLILGIASSLRLRPQGYDGPPLLVVVRNADAVMAAAIRTQPYKLILSEVDDPQAVPALLDELRDLDLPGVVGPPTAVQAFADGWVAQRGGRWRTVLNERIFRLRTLVPPRTTDGEARLALADDRDLITSWLAAFGTEVLDETDADRTQRNVEDWERGGRRYWLWESSGRAVSMVGAGGETPNGIRIGPVYTPPDHRGRGYASNLTAFVSRTVLDEGRSFCFLYTDVANPTSNRIYQSIGYEPVGDAMMVAFD